MPGIFAISDPHLPTQTQINKYRVPFDYFQQVINHLESVNPDILLIAGDLVWGSDIAEIQVELDLLQNLPGKLKFFIEGNHDLWVDRLATSYSEVQQKMYERFSTSNFFYIGGRASIVSKGSIKVGICGARGFAFDQYEKPIENELLFRQNELESLDKSLIELKSKIKTEHTTVNLCLMHYPPTISVFENQGIKDEKFIEQIQNIEIINKVIFGHVHVEEDLRLYTTKENIELYCATIDRNNYNAVKILDI
ncbi:MAG: metallophosphoesterase [Patescibacteria group bacterium]|nr:metallophosphoesterase [Patescibacteria group bacterium]